MEEDRQRLESVYARKPNSDILEHDRKRRVEIQCIELQDAMEEQGYACKLLVGVDHV